ncbi:MAG: type II toxin-antitoxin system VapB family antitoxin [Candidatus Binatia bacterium]
MRTTVVLKDDLVKKAKKISGASNLSALLNSCLAEWIAQHDRRELKTRLLEEYRSGRQESRRISREFAHTDKEGWPSW